jgi:hypothetical protein
VHPIEVGEVELGKRLQDHQAGRVDDDVDPAELELDRVERRRHRVLVGHVTADGDGPAALSGDGLDHLVGPGLVACVVHGDVHAVAGQAFGRDPADAARAAGHDRDALLGRGHGVLLLELRGRLGARRSWWGPYGFRCSGPPWHQPCRDSLSRR